MFKEFKEFISKGNVMDMAVGVIIGGAFAKIVTALTSSFIQPLLNWIGGAEVQGRIPQGNSGQLLKYGDFITAVINFLIIAFVLFLMIKIFNTAEKRSKEKLKDLAMKTGRLKKADSKEEPTKKLCPYCLSEIPYKATKCAHCASDLEEPKKTTKKASK